MVGFIDTVATECPQSLSEVNVAFLSMFPGSYLKFLAGRRCKECKTTACPLGI